MTVNGKNVEIVEVISKSEKSEVYLAALENSEVPVVLKVIRNADISIYRELSKIDSPFISHIYEIAEEGETIYVIEEYLAGSTLAALIEKRNIDINETIEYAIQICEGVSALHNCKPPIIHRDIKPDNFIVGENNVVSLIDFDASRNYKRNQDSDTVKLGTLEYAPPEQFGFSQTDARSDIYSIGAVIYEMLFGKTFHLKVEENDRDVLLKGRESLKSRLQRIVYKCTMFSPEQRYQTVEELLKDLYELKKPQKKKQVRSLLFLLLLAAGVGIGSFCMNREKSFDLAKVTMVDGNSVNRDLIYYFETTYRDEEGQQQSLVIDYEKEKGKKKPLILRSAYMAGREIDFIWYRKREEAQYYILPKKYYSMENQLLKIDGRFMDSLEQGKHLFEVYMGGVAYPAMVQIYVEGAGYEKNPAILNNGYFEYYADKEEDVCVYLYNAHDRKLEELYIDGKPTKKENYRINETGEALYISHELLNTIELDNEEVSYQLRDSLGEMYDVSIMAFEKAQIYPIIEYSQRIYNKDSGEDFLIRVKWNDASGIWGIYGMGQNDGIPEEYYQTTEEGIVIDGEYLSSLERGTYYYIIEFGRIGVRTNLIIE